MEITFSDLLGKKILVGITYYTHEHQLIEQMQYHGTVTRSDEKAIVIRKENGDSCSLPPDLRSTKPAPAGEYRLRSTGEIVVDPDFLSTWNVIKDDSEE